MTRRPYASYTVRHGSANDNLPIVTERVVDVSDATAWPEIARAIEHAKQIRLDGISSRIRGDTRG